MNVRKRWHNTIVKSRANTSKNKINFSQQSFQLKLLLGELKRISNRKNISGINENRKDISLTGKIFPMTAKNRKSLSLTGKVFPIIECTGMT